MTTANTSTDRSLADRFQPVRDRLNDPATRHPTGGSPIVPPRSRPTVQQPATPRPQPRPEQVRWVEGVGYVDADGNKVD